MALIIILITLGLSSSNMQNEINQNKLLKCHSIVNRKISSINRNNLTLVGFGDYEEGNDIFAETIPYDYIQFKVYFIGDKNLSNYNHVNISILVQLANHTNLSRTIRCNHTNNINTYKIKASSYFCRNIFLNGLSNIEAVTPIVNYKFYNTTNPALELTEQKIEKSSISDMTINSLRNQTTSIDYDTFYLNEIELEKNKFILKGNYSANVTETQINLNLSGTIYNASVTKEEIKFNASTSSKIDEYLHGKMQKNAEGKYILIYSGQGVDDHLIYPVENQFIEVLGFGNYQPPTKEQDAKNRLYLTGTQYYLNNLKKYIKFNTTIFFNSLRLRNLVESSITIEANGTLVENNQEKDLAMYDNQFQGTANKSISGMTAPFNIRFSDNGIDYEKMGEEFNIPLYINLLEEDNFIFEKMTSISKVKRKNSTAFYLDFTLSESSNIENQNTSYLKYIPANNNTIEDQVKCSIQKQSLSFRIICFPKKNIFTNISTIKIVIKEKSSNLRIRFLQSETNTVLLPPSNADGIINFTYSQPKFNYRHTKSGLSAGAIVAIVLSTVAVVVAIGIALVFLHKMKANPPPIRYPSDMNLANSNSNINK